MTVQRVSSDARVALTGILNALIDIVGDSPTCEVQVLLTAILNDKDFWLQSNDKPSCLLSHFDAGSQGLFYKGENWGQRWIFKNHVYEVVGKAIQYTDAEKSLLIQDEFDAERRKFERLQRNFSGANQCSSLRERPRVSEEVRIAVWRRDGGCCARCGSRENLEYDHIIPISKGGSNTVRNIELLCEACNRGKGDRIE